MNEDLLSLPKECKTPVRPNIVYLIFIVAKMQPLLQLLAQLIQQPLVRPILKTITEINIIIQLLLKRKIEVMELLNKTTRINAEALMSALRHRKGTMPRFNLPLSEEDAFDSLMSAIKVEVEFRRREFVATEELKAQVRRLSTFLTQENCKFGIVLAGGCGNGKTTIIKALQSLVNVLHIPNPYTDKEYVMRIIDAKSMAAICKSNYEDWKRLMHQDLLAIDDLGTEPREVMDYGNIINPTEDILTRRYENQLFTIISTNLTPPQISQVYGERIADRMREMMEIIPFTNSSYRLLK